MLDSFFDIKLTSDQQEAVNAIDIFLNSDKRVFILKGYAGTGKTTLLKGLGRYFKEKMVEVLQENLQRNPDISPAVQATFNEAMAQVEDLHRGDEMAFAYTPGVGTALIVREETKMVMKGPEAMQATFAIFVGPQPATEALKAGLLGK